MNQFTRRAVMASLLAGLLGVAPGAGAQEKTIRIVVGFPPGGATDVLAREVANALGPKIGRSIIVENKPGASGNIAANVVATAPADGTTLLFASSTFATNATLYKKLPFDTEKDFSAIGMVATTPYVLVVHPSLQAKSVPEFIAYLKKNPDRLQYATASQGTGQHLAAELFKDMAGVEMTQIPYKGSSAALPDVLAGRMPVMFDNVAVMTPHIRSGAVRALAVTSTQPSPLLAGIPTVAETLPGYEIQGWFALLAPARTPSALVQSMNNALVEVVQDPSFRARLEKIGAQPMQGSAPSADAYVRGEISRWRGVIRSANITLD